MKKSLFLLIALFTIISCREDSTSRVKLSSPDETTTTPSPDNSVENPGVLKGVDDIKKEYSYITSGIANGSIDSTSFNYNCREEKMGKITYFSEKGQLRMINHTYNEYSHFSGTNEYLIKNDSLFFVYSNEKVWNFTGQNQTEDKITEERFYIIDNKPIKCLEKKFTILIQGNDTLESSSGKNYEIECPPIESISEDFELLYKLRHQKEDLTCLED